MNQNQDWLVVMTKPQMEAKAKEELINQNFAVYLPLWVDLKLRKMKWVEVISPMFPRYLFVRPTEENQSLSAIRSTIGVSQFLRFGLEPACANDELIEQIKGLENSRKNSKAELKPFETGDEVVVTEGPFKGNLAKVLASDKDRVTLLLKVLGKTHALKFDNNSCKSTS